MGCWGGGGLATLVLKRKMAIYGPPCGCDGDGRCSQRQRNVVATERGGGVRRRSLQRDGGDLLTAASGSAGRIT